MINILLTCIKILYNYNFCQQKKLYAFCKWLFCEVIKKKGVTVLKNVSGLYTLTVLRFNTICCCFWIVFG